MCQFLLKAVHIWLEGCLKSNYIKYVAQTLQKKFHIKQKSFTSILSVMYGVINL